MKLSKEVRKKINNLRGEVAKKNGVIRYLMEYKFTWKLFTDKRNKENL